MNNSVIIILVNVFTLLSVSLFCEEKTDDPILDMPKIIIPMQNDYGFFLYHDQDMKPISNKDVWKFSYTVPANKDVVNDGRVLSNIGASLGCIAAACLISWVGLEVTESNNSITSTAIPLTFGISLISGNLFANTAKKKMEFAVHNYNAYYGNY